MPSECNLSQGNAVNSLVAFYDIDGRKVEVPFFCSVPDTTRLTHDKIIDHYHNPPFNIPTAGAQAFLMDYPQGERAITHHAGPVRIGGC
jgi:hypothetical protein